MNKQLKIIVLTFVMSGMFFGGGLLSYFLLADVSALVIEKQLGRRFDPNYRQEAIQRRRNSSALGEITETDENGVIITKPYSMVDQRRDILFYPDARLQYTDQSQLSGEWMMFGIPKTEQYEIGISVCNNGVFGCETTYYQNPSCLKLIYIPRYRNRQRDENVMSGCEIVDISKKDRHRLYFSVKY